MASHDRQMQKQADCFGRVSTPCNDLRGARPASATQPHCLNPQERWNYDLWNNAAMGTDRDCPRCCASPANHRALCTDASVRWRVPPSRASPDVVVNARRLMRLILRRMYDNTVALHKEEGSAAPFPCDGTISHRSHGMLGLLPRKTAPR